MPAVVSLVMILAVIIPLFVVTVALRALPFGLLRYLRNSDFMAVLGRTMPVGVMTGLVVYTWHGQMESPGGVFSIAIAVAATYLLHTWRNDVGLSSLGGTLTYMLIVIVVLWFPA